jgi:hypothetical protein
MLSWIPLLGPIIQGLTTIFTKTKDTELEKYKTDSNASIQTLSTFRDDIGVRVMRDMVCFPVVVWSMIIGWDTIVVRHYPNLVFIVEKYPDSVAYLPYAVLIFLLGNIGINAWKSR